MKRIFILTAVVMAAILTGCKVQDNGSLPRGEASPEMIAAVDAFVEATKTVPQDPSYINLHSIMIVKDGKVLVEKWFNGETPEKPHTMWSVSKTFTSMAAGLAISEGLLNLDDKLVSFFPEDLPEEVSDNLAAITVRDLLTMNCGHDTELHIVGVDTVDNWIKAFLAHPVVHTPGTRFLYNTAGTFMVSAIVQKVTGQKINDYLETRLWNPLHIDKPDWLESPQGINCGGWGLSLKTEDMAKVGQMLLQNGEWQGRQVIPADWVKAMTSFQVPSHPSGVRYEDLEAAGITKETSDWMQGYGYQIWLCRHGAFRADGANGQYIMVFPERGTVLVLTTDSNLYQPYVDIIWQYLLPVL